MSHDRFIARDNKERGPFTGQQLEELAADQVAPDHHPDTTPIPVLHVAGVPVTPEDQTHALEEGAVPYLTKPVEPRHLIPQAKALLHLRQVEERARVDRQWHTIFDALGEGVCLSFNR